MMQQRFISQGEDETERVRQPLSECQRLITSLYSALRIAQDPQDVRQYTEVLDHGVVPEKIRRGVIPLRAIQGLGVFQVRPGKRELPLEKQRISLKGVRLDEHKRVLDRLPELEKLARQRMHRLMVGSHKEEDVEPHQRPHVFCGIVHFLAQCSRPPIDVLHFFGGVPTDRHERLPKSGLESQFLPDTLRRVRQNLE
jgi:hypothetical protein